MIDLKVTDERICYERKLFYKKPRYFDALRLVEYNITSNTSNIPGFKREKIFTKVINLIKPPEELLAQCRKNTKYEIKRAEKEGIEFGIEDNIDAFIDFYNSFVESKNNSKDVLNLSKNYFYCFRNNLIITKAIFENEIRVMHSYIMDKETKRVRLLNTASLFRYGEDFQKRNLIGRANRFLHYQDMIYFKNSGFEIYDMGGYGYNTDDVVIQKINEFKDSFGGELLEESWYISLPLYLIRLLRTYQKKIFSF